MPTIQFSTTVRTGDDFTNVTVIAHVLTYFPGSWDEPPHGPEAEIQSVTDSDGKELDLTDEQYDLLESEAIEHIYEEMREIPEDY